MYGHYENLGTPTGIGRTESQALDLGIVAASPSVYAFELGIRKTPAERISSIIAHPRATTDTWTGTLYLYGCKADTSRERDWRGPIGVQTVSATFGGPTLKTIGSTDWYCGGSRQFDTQDYPYVAFLVQIESSATGFASGSGLVIDVDVQDATSSA